MEEQITVLEKVVSRLVNEKVYITENDSYYGQKKLTVHSFTRNQEFFYCIVHTHNKQGTMDYLHEVVKAIQMAYLVWLQKKIEYYEKIIIDNTTDPSEQTLDDYQDPFE